MTNLSLQPKETEVLAKHFNGLKLTGKEQSILAKVKKKIAAAVRTNYTVEVF
jgi:hypothetical protein